MPTPDHLFRVLPVEYKFLRLAGNPIEFLYLAKNLTKNGQPRYNSYQVACSNISSLLVGTQIIIAGDIYEIHSSSTFDPEDPYHIPACSSSFCGQLNAIISRVNGNPNAFGRYRLLEVGEFQFLYNTVAGVEINYKSTCTPSSFGFFVVALVPDLFLNVRVLRPAPVAPHPFYIITQVTELEAYEKRDGYKVVIYPHVNKGVYDPNKQYIPASTIPNPDYWELLTPQSATPQDYSNLIAQAEPMIIPQAYEYSYNNSKVAYFNLSALVQSAFARQDLPDILLESTQDGTFVYVVPQFYSVKQLKVYRSCVFDGLYRSYVQEYSDPCNDDRDLFSTNLFVLNGRLPDAGTDYYYIQKNCSDVFNDPLLFAQSPMLQTEAYMENYYFDGSASEWKFLNSYAPKRLCNRQREYLYLLSSGVIRNTTISDFYISVTQYYADTFATFTQHFPLSLPTNYISDGCPDIENQLLQIPLYELNLFNSYISFGESVEKVRITISYFDLLTLSYIPIIIPIEFYQKTECCNDFPVFYKNAFGLIETLSFDKVISKTIEVEKEDQFLNTRGFIHKDTHTTDLKNGVADIYEKYVLSIKNAPKTAIQDLLYSDIVYILDQEKNALQPAVIENKDILEKSVQDITEQRITIKRRIK